MIRSALVALTVMFMASAAHAGFTLRLDATQAREVLAILEAGQADDARLSALAAHEGTREGVRHHAKFSSAITEATWRKSFTAALAGAPVERDMFQMKALLADREKVASALAQIIADPAAFEREVTAMVAPYTPAGVSVDARMVLVASTPGTGWTDDAGAFYFDIGRSGGDLAGARTVAAHELYHLVLERVLARPRLTDGSGLARVEAILRNGIDEGMASHIARYGGETGPLSKMMLRFERINTARTTANFKLMDAMILAAANSSAITPDDVGVIAFSGTYDEAGYYVFRDMAAAIEAERGRAYLVSLLTTPPTRFVLAYHDLGAADGRPRLHPETLAVVAALDRRLG